MRFFVIDTNAVIQILGGRSKYNYLFKKLAKGDFGICVSNEILFEYAELLNQKSSPIVADFFIKFLETSDFVIRKDPFFRLNLIKSDFDDNKFVDCAFACQVEYIVSDDKHFDVLKDIPFPKVTVKRLDEFAKEFPI